VRQSPRREGKPNRTLSQSARVLRWSDFGDLYLSTSSWFHYVQR